MSTKKFSKVWGNSSTQTSAKKFNKALKSSRALRSNKISSSTALTASTTSNFSFYSTQTLTSKKCHEEEFTNFLNEDELSNYKLRMYPILDDPSKMAFANFREYSVTLDSRIKKIMLEYMTDVDFENHKDDFIKFSVLDYFGQVTQYRIFLYKDLAKNKYIVFLVDPLHLVIPDKVTKDANTYNRNESNTICISTLHIK